MSYALTPAGTPDLEFLRALFLSVRADEFAGLDPFIIDVVLAMQLRAQLTDYASRFPNGDHSIVTVDGERAGRLLVDRAADHVRLVDVSLLPQWRGRGVGGAIVADLVAEAGARGVPVRLSVIAANPARRLYERHGFVTVAEAPPYLEMERPA